MTVIVLFKSESLGPDKFTTALKTIGFNVQSISCISFVYKNCDTVLEELSKPEDYDGIIFTSPRAVRGVLKAVESFPGVINKWIAKRNFSIGQTTTELCENLLNLRTEGKETGNATELSSFICSRCQDETSLRNFLFPAGNLRQDTLENSLKECSITLRPIEIYDTIENPELEKSIEALKNTILDFIVFFSPSGVQFSLPLLKKHKINLETVKFIAIGPTTKKTIEENGLKCSYLCSKPTPEDLIKILPSFSQDKDSNS